MIVPEQVFNFTRPQDQVGQYFDVVSRVDFSAIGAGLQAGTSGVLYRVPQDRCLFVSSFGATITSTSASNVWLTGCQLFAGTGTTSFLSTVAATSQAQVSGAGGRECTIGTACDIVIPGDAVILLRYSISLPTAAGEVVLPFFHGVSVPRGNVTRG